MIRPTLQSTLDDPGATYRSPQAVVDDPRLTMEQQERVLAAWEAQVRSASPDARRLSQIQAARVLLASETERLR